MGARGGAQGRGRRGDGRRGGGEGGDGRRRLPDAGRRRSGGVRAGEGREDGGADASRERSPDQGVPEQGAAAPLRRSGG